MYQEFIDQLQPQPKLNLEWYQNDDKYSDGNVEDLVLRLIAENEPEDYTEAIYQNYNWPTYYHLSHERKNILNWYPFKKDASVLEIGCGMGALTGILCDRCEKVTAVELSKRRATATLLRCRYKNNLEIIVGNLNDIEFKEKFDYITLIGVLEYQGSYTDTDNPYLDFLRKIKGLLKPDGKLLIAIENQYGLKYWCGAREDHVGIPFMGINQYALTERKVRTFSKEALDTLIKRSGFKNTYFYYPMPDYKLPTVIYSQEYLPQNGNILNMHCYYAPDSKGMIAEERELYPDIVKNQVFEFFSNSFLVECGDVDELGEITFASLASVREKEYRIGTRFRKNETVEKFPISKEWGGQHVRQIMKNQEELEKRGIAVWKSHLRNECLVSDFCKSKLLEEHFMSVCAGGEEERACEILDMVYNDILRSSEEISWEENILYTFDLGIEPNKEKYGVILKTGYLDMLLRNAFWMDGQVCWFDQEWILENVPAKYVLYRLLREFYLVNREMNNLLPLEKLLTHYGLMDLVEDFEKVEGLFKNAVTDYRCMEERNGFSGKGKKECAANIMKLIQS